MALYKKVLTHESYRFFEETRNVQTDIITNHDTNHDTHHDITSRFYSVSPSEAVI